MKPDIVFEENNIIICYKPPGVASQSERSFETDLLSSVMTHLTQNNKPAYAAIINRLDKPVGGLVLFACDKKTASALSALSGEHSIEKYYYAIVTGKLEPTGEFTDYLLKEATKNQSKVVKENTPGAKKARLRYEVLEEKEIEGVVYSLVRIRLLTGRHHQIRVQFAHHGHGLYGDMKYNLEFSNRKGIFPALFAYKISFMNPSGIPRITVEVKPKGDIWNFAFFENDKEK